MRIFSLAFDDNGMIPAEFTCDDADISPPLDWDAAPDGTISFTIICEDPDAPAGTWTHWVIFNLPAGMKGLEGGITNEKVLDNGAIQGVNDFGRIGYGGPCPPGGTHRYYFKIYALDRKLDLRIGATKKELLEAMQGHVLGEGQLMGRYRRKSPIKIIP